LCAATTLPNFCRLGVRREVSRGRLRAGEESLLHHGKLLRRRPAGLARPGDDRVSERLRLGGDLGLQLAPAFRPALIDLFLDCRQPRTEICDARVDLGFDLTQRAVHDSADDLFGVRQALPDGARCGRHLLRERASAVVESGQKRAPTLAGLVDMGAQRRRDAVGDRLRIAGETLRRRFAFQRERLRGRAAGRLDGGDEFARALRKAALDFVRRRLERLRDRLAFARQRRRRGVA
jgi:hypothetical protein